MERYYTSITDTVINALNSMAANTHDTVICDAQDVSALARYVYLSWENLVGEVARADDRELMIRVLDSMARQK